MLEMMNGKDLCEEVEEKTVCCDEKKIEVEEALTGQEYDSETGLYYYGARYYDAGIGRFISPDSVVDGKGLDTQGYNRYAYARNNPINYSDPTGHNWLFTFLGALAIVVAITVVSAIVGGVVSVLSGKDFLSGAIAGAMIGVGLGIAAVGFLGGDEKLMNQGLGIAKLAIGYIFNKDVGQVEFFGFQFGDTGKKNNPGDSGGNKNENKDDTADPQKDNPNEDDDTPPPIVYKPLTPEQETTMDMEMAFGGGDKLVEGGSAFDFDDMSGLITKGWNLLNEKHLVFDGKFLYLKNILGFTVDKWSAVSGPWGNNRLPNGRYIAGNISITNLQGMVKDGVGFWQAISPQFNTTRNGLGIHPDQEGPSPSRPGTSGCIGLTGNASELNRYFNTMNSYFNIYNSINVKVNY